MNNHELLRVPTYDMQMFDILGINPTRMDVVHLSTAIDKWLYKNEYQDRTTIQINQAVSDLSGLKETGTYDITYIGHDMENGWWGFVFMVHERWKR